MMICAAHTPLLCLESFVMSSLMQFHFSPIRIAPSVTSCTITAQQTSTV